jgi:hypothetical protein
MESMISRRQRALLVLLFLGALLVPSLPIVRAETYIIVYDQENETVTSKVELIGARLYNETHAMVEDSFFVAITYKGVRLYRLDSFKDNATYAVKVALGHLVLEIPRGLYYKVTHIETGSVFEGISEGKPINCGLLPYGLIEVYVIGIQELRDVVDWQGGPIRVKEEVKLEPKALLLLLPSLIPVVTPVAFTAYYVYGRHKLLASVRRPSLKISPHNSHTTSDLHPKPATKVIAKPLDVNVRRKNDKLMKILEVTSKPPMSIADLIERDAKWLERELKKAKNCPRQINVRLALVRLREKMRPYVEERTKKLRHALANLICKIASDKIDIVIYYYPVTGRGKPRREMKKFGGLLRPLTNALRLILSLARGARNPARPLKAHKS